MQAELDLKSVSIGFLTARYHPQSGYIGGYLILNLWARPLEFHCTLPLVPSRAQQILFGATLGDFVCGEQIARVLTQRAKLTPTFLLTDAVAVLALRNLSNIPIAHLEFDRTNSTLMIPESQRPNESLHAFTAYRKKFRTLKEFDRDAQTIQSILSRPELSIDIEEPFGRIDEALLEAHPQAKAA